MTSGKSATSQVSHCTYTVLTLSSHCRYTVGTLSSHCRSTVDALPLYCRHTVLTASQDSALPALPSVYSLMVGNFYSFFSPLHRFSSPTTPFPFSA
jgi:hypothetical protein